MNTLVPAYAKQCAVDKADPGAFPHTASLHKENERSFFDLGSMCGLL